MVKVVPVVLALGVVASGHVMSALRRNHEDKPNWMHEEGTRYAWNDCGGNGASASMKIRSLAAKLEGAEPPRHFMRNAGQDCEETSEVGEHRAYDGHNGFDPPATVYMRVCAAMDQDECEGDIHNCNWSGGECGVNQDAHMYNGDVVFPSNPSLYADADMALGRAEEVTHAGIVELKVTGTDSSNDGVRAAQASADFSADEAKSGV